VWEVVGCVGENGLTEAQLLATDGLCAVAVETRIEEACATAQRCLTAGLHVHLDKPGALEHEAFKAMRLLAEKKQLTVQMGYMLRYNPAFALLFQAVREGWLGEITEIDTAMGKLADGRVRSDIGALTGGGMFELAGHVIDAVVTLLGKPQAVQSFSTPTQSDGVHNQLAVLHYAKATATVRCNHADPFGGPRRRFNVTGTEGTFEILPLESGKVSLSLTKPRGSHKKGTELLKLTVPKDRYAEEFLDLARVVRGEKKLAWDAVHDITTHETLLRAAGVWR
jgi:predicted dehydrogenase